MQLVGDAPVGGGGRVPVLAHRAGEGVEDAPLRGREVGRGRVGVRVARADAGRALDAADLDRGRADRDRVSGVDPSPPAHAFAVDERPVVREALVLHDEVRAEPDELRV